MWIILSDFILTIHSVLHCTIKSVLSPCICERYCIIFMGSSIGISDSRDLRCESLKAVYHTMSGILVIT